MAFTPLAQGSCVPLSSLSLCSICSWKCSPLRFSAPGLAFQGHMPLSGGLCPWLCHAMSDTLLGPFGPHHLPGLPVGPAEPGRGFFSLTGPRVCNFQVSLLQGHWHYLSSVVLSGTASDTKVRREAPMKRTFAFFKQTSTVLDFFGLLLIPGSATLLLNQLVSKAWETGRLPLPGSMYFVTLLLYLMYYNLYQIALCLLKWTIRIQL